MIELDSARGWWIPRWVGEALHEMIVPVGLIEAIKELVAAYCMIRDQEGWRPIAEPNAEEEEGLLTKGLARGRAMFATEAGYGAFMEIYWDCVDARRTSPTEKEEAAAPPSAEDRMLETVGWGHLTAASKTRAKDYYRKCADTGKKVRRGGGKGGRTKADDARWPYAKIRGEAIVRHRRIRTVEPARVIVALSREIAGDLNIRQDAAEKRIRRAIGPLVVRQRAGNRDRLLWRGQ